LLAIVYVRDAMDPWTIRGLIRVLAAGQLPHTVRPWWIPYRRV